MKNFYRLTAAMAVLILTLSVSASCMTKTSNDTPSHAESEPKYDFTAYFGNADDGVIIEEAVSAYAKEKGVKIETVLSNGTERAVRRQLNSDNPPTVYVIPSEVDTKKIAEEGQLLDLTGKVPGTDKGGLPWSVEGFGLIADTRLLAELIQGGTLDTIISDIKKADYMEWVTFTAALDAYINNGTAASFKLGGRDYSFPKTKGELVSKLNGVYAAPGGDSGVMVGDLMSLVISGMSAEYLSAEDSSNIVVKSILGRYVLCFESCTSALAGRYAPGVRGTDFIDGEKYSKSAAEEIFAEDKAAFLLARSDAAEGIQKLNAVKADNCIMLPLKTPNTETNTKLMAKSINIMYVNAEADYEKREKATAFLKWLSGYELNGDTHIEKSVYTYFVADAVSAFPEQTKKLENFAENIYRDSAATEYMADPVWNSAKRSAFTAAAEAVWDAS